MITAYFVPKVVSDAPRGAANRRGRESDDNTTAAARGPPLAKRFKTGTQQTPGVVSDEAKGLASCPDESAAGNYTEDDAVDIESSQAQRSKNSALQASGALSDDVKELIAFLDDPSENDSRECDTVSWRKELDRCFRSASFARLAGFVVQERSTYTVYPAAANTFAALNFTPIDKVKVVIVGQDPYHGPGQAHGMCFSVLPGVPPPPSLKNMFVELRDDPKVPFRATMPSHGHLVRWARQGVLLLNTVLTVRRGVPNSHQNQGWEPVTDEILRAVDRHCLQARRGVVFMLWGRPRPRKRRPSYLEEEAATPSFAPHIPVH